MAKQQFSFELGPLHGQYELLRQLHEGATIGLPAVDLARDRRNQRIMNFGTAAVTVYFPTGKQVLSIPALVGGRLSVRQAGRIYGGHLLPFPSTVGMAALLLRDASQSRSQDEKPRLFNNDLSVRPKTLRDTKTFKTGSSGQTSKPFWSKGKPKCKKGFRYDFKRKLCVKIK
ncbi:MAG: hypothetical protein [Circular genetic element sp.]|nr:MAG: hypothetical protein [Circular genetic element sp.]